MQYVFRSVDRHGNVVDTALAPGSVARIVKRAARAGLEPAAYFGDSLRARHTSKRVLREYIREGQLFDETPTGELGL